MSSFKYHVYLFISFLSGVAKLIIGLCLSVVAIASIPSVLMGLSDGIKHIEENYLVYLVLAACGFAVGNAFYFLNHWRSPNLNAREGAKKRVPQRRVIR
jgi:hypothetical protein